MKISISLPNDGMEAEKPSDLRDEVIYHLKTVVDPEIPINVYDLGLIYGCEVNEEQKEAHITMTLTAPNCPVADDILKDVQNAAAKPEGIEKAVVNLVFSPPWNRDKMTEDGKMEMEAMGL